MRNLAQDQKPWTSATAHLGIDPWNQRIALHMKAPSNRGHRVWEGNPGRVVLTNAPAQPHGPLCSSGLPRPPRPPTDSF